MKTETLDWAEVSWAVRSGGVIALDVLKPELWFGEVFGSFLFS